jgi:hypothetical protein
MLCEVLILNTQRESATGGNPRFAGMFGSMTGQPSTGVSSNRVSRQLLDSCFWDLPAFDIYTGGESSWETCPNRRLRAVVIGRQLVVANGFLCRGDVPKCGLIVITASLYRRDDPYRH